MTLEKMDGLETKVQRTSLTFDALGKKAMGLMGMIGVVNTITDKMKEFAEANRAQQEAEAKLA